MTAPQIIDELDKCGVKVGLGISCSTENGEPLQDVATLLSQLADERDAAIDYLIAGRMIPLPDDVAIPAEWNISGKVKRYILDAPGEILRTIEERQHSPLFTLLWAVKALCFINGGKVMYERIEAAMRDAYGFDYEQYAEDWRRKAAQDIQPEGA